MTKLEHLLMELTLGGSNIDTLINDINRNVKETEASIDGSNIIVNIKKEPSLKKLADLVKKRKALQASDNYGDDLDKVESDIDEAEADRNKYILSVFYNVKKIAQGNSFRVGSWHIVSMNNSFFGGRYANQKDTVIAINIQPIEPTR